MKTLPAEMRWLISSENVTDWEDITDEDIRRGSRVLICIEQSVRNKFNDSHGPLFLLLGM